jgi:hypothetical protein
VAYFSALGYLPPYPASTLAPALAAKCVACTLVESLPLGGLLDDNVSVPAAAAGLTLILLPPLAVAAALAGVAGAGAAPAAEALARL